MTFKILTVNGQRLSAPIVKDTVDVEAHMGSVVIEFTAHNSGDWFLHCHKPDHMEGGMISGRLTTRMASPAEPRSSRSTCTSIRTTSIMAPPPRSTSTRSWRTSTGTTSRVCINRP